MGIIIDEAVSYVNIMKIPYNFLCRRIVNNYPSKWSKIPEQSTPPDDPSPENCHNPS